ncbi:3-(3-hydroxy-phenyl)propionate/3-hydroxycinnamic acid hydroxylase [Streptomyces tendae]
MSGAGTADTQVVVVGAGPVGLMLAGELRLGGVEVTVLERLDTPTTESRASTLHARTMEILRQRGLLDAPGGFADPLPPREPRGHFGGLPLDLTLPSSHPGQWKVPQVRTEAILGAWADRLGARVLRGHHVVSVEQDADRVRVVAEHAGRRTAFTARYAVGCDGERSAVRRLAGIGFPGADAERELLRADVDGIEIPDRRFQRLPHGLAIAARRGDGVTRVMVHRFGTPPRAAGEPDFADVVTSWRDVTGEDVSGGTPLWVNSFGDASRQAEHYRRGRILLAGDAAHQQMPIGGQALNLGLQDAVNLGWKLAATVSGRAPEGLLDTYHEERHAVGRRVLSTIRDGPPGGHPAAPRHYGVGGAAALTAALLALVHGVTALPAHGWSDVRFLGSMTAAALLLAWFRSLERAAPAPLLPVHLLRGGALIRSALGAACLNGSYLGLLFVLTYQTQTLAGWSPPVAAAALLPAAVPPAITALASGRLISRFGAPRLIAAGAASAFAGLLLQLRSGWPLDYTGRLLPTLLLVGLGFVLSFAALNVQATSELAPADRAAGSGLYQTAVQLAAVLAVALVAALLAGAGGDGGPAARLAACRPALVLVAALGGLGLLTALTGLLRPGAAGRSSAPRT